MTFVDFSHVGIVVADLDAAIDELVGLVGLDFERPRTESLRLRTASGTVDCTFRFTYSRSPAGVQAIELIEAPSGSPWWPGDGPVVPAIHHLGFWAADFTERVAALADGGAPVEVTVAGREPRLFTYHQTRHGPRIELVDRERKPDIDHWTAS
ncbi:VOC family protein [Pseudonocardia thermophila]|uniref:VOC family protein n=1 Tax=Pseudonocardia thermophila TaxID=1848 RepID=UPI00248D598E|nr:VOC family protein [Pseudonocardia thermophila]